MTPPLRVVEAAVRELRAASEAADAIRQTSTLARGAEARIAGALRRGEERAVDAALRAGGTDREVAALTSWSPASVGRRRARLGLPTAAILTARAEAAEEAIRAHSARARAEARLRAWEAQDRAEREARRLRDAAIYEDLRAGALRLLAVEPRSARQLGEALGIEDGPLRDRRIQLLARALLALEAEGLIEHQGARRGRWSRWVLVGG